MPTCLDFYRRYEAIEVDSHCFVVIIFYYQVLPEKSESHAPFNHRGARSERAAELNVTSSMESTECVQR